MKLSAWILIVASLIASLSSAPALAGGPKPPAQMSWLELRTELARRNLGTVKECGPNALVAILFAAEDTIPGASALTDTLVLLMDPIGYGMAMRPFEENDLKRGEWGGIVGPILAAFSKQPGKSTYEKMKRSAEAAYLSTRIAYQDLHAPWTDCGKAERAGLEIAQEIGKRKTAAAALREAQDQRATDRKVLRLVSAEDQFKYLPLQLSDTASSAR